MIEALIIDVDDTLCLTEAACFALENETLARMGRKPMSRDVHLATWGQLFHDAMKVRSPGIDIEAFKLAFLPVQEEYIRNGKLDVIPQCNYDALDTLLAQNKKLFVLTSRTFDEVGHMLAADHLLASRIEAFYHKDNTQFHKPDPRVFNELLAAQGLCPERSVYVGDSIGDAAASKQAGLKFVASLESGLRQPEDFKDHEVDAFINRFPDIVSAIAMLDLR